MSNLIVISPLELAKREACELKTEFFGAKKDLILVGVEWGNAIAQVKGAIGHGKFIPWVEKELQVSRGWAATLMRAAEAYSYLIQMYSQLYICEHEYTNSVEALALMRDDAKAGKRVLDGERKARKPPRPRQTPVMGSQTYQEDVAAATDNIVDEREAEHSAAQNELLALRAENEHLRAEVARLRARVAELETEGAHQ